MTAAASVHYFLHGAGRMVGLREGWGAVLGREASCDLVLPRLTVSRRHARFSVERGSAFVEDLGSHNGVLVNGMAISGRSRVSEHDAIDVGGEAIRIRGPVVGTPEEVATRPVAISARMYLDEANHALAAARLEAARGALDNFVMAVEAAAAGGTASAPLVEEGTRALLGLSERTHDASPLAAVLRLRRMARLPLDAATTETVATAIAALAPAAADAERLVYCRWMRRQPASFSERRAVLALERARG